MDLGISGRKALVLAGSQGLGLACAQALSQAGVHVAVNGRDPQRAHEAAALLGEGAIAIAGDISDPDVRQTVMKRAQQHLGPISIIVTNAGGPPPGLIESHDRSAWLQALETNMLAALDFACMGLPDMKAGGFGRIVNITSFTVREPYENMGLATGVRAGLTGAMASLSREVAAQGITVNNLLPGLMNTGALARVYKAQAARDGISEDEAKARMAASIPMQRLGTASDFGQTCAFICSVYASYMTGQNITIDGGLVRSLL